MSIKNHNVAFSWFGVLGVAVFLICWVAATVADPSWEFATNTLSEFGISDTDAAYFFNYGCCILTGALLAIFGVGNVLTAKNNGYLVGGLLLIVGSAFLALVGIVTMNYGNGDPHDVIATSMAAILVFSVAAFAIGNWNADRKIVAGTSMVIVIIIICMAIEYSAAELEAYGIILMFAWIIIECMRMITTKRKG